jgi:8-oxo-dGTP pyrophosphatase MutT (NUDIX family)
MTVEKDEFMLQKWNVLSSHIILQRPPWLTVEEQNVQLPNGYRIDGYLLTPLPEVSMVFALTTEEEVLLVEQYKHGCRHLLWDLPAGYIDAGEEPFAAAQRELEEETGYRSENWQALGDWFIDPNRTEARFHYYLARECQADGRRHLDKTEDIIVHRVPLKEISTVHQDGRMLSLASWAGVNAALNNLNGR